MDEQDVAEEIESTECKECGQFVLFDEVKKVDDESYCEICFNEHFLMCANCEKPERDDNSFFANNESYCEGCFDDLFFSCHHCDTYVRKEYWHLTSNGNSICQTCYEADFFTCDNCSDIFHTECYGGNGECQGCYEPEPEEEDEPRHVNIHDYSFKPIPHFLMTKKEMTKRLLQPPGTKALFFGVELECANEEQTVDNDEAALEVLKIANEYKEDHVYLKEDSSIDPDGFEIVTHPATLDYHLQGFKWGEITNYLSSKGFTSHNNKTCGLHIHVSKNFFSQVEQVKLALFVYGNREMMERLSRRSSIYAAFKDVKKEIKDHKKALERERSIEGRRIDNIPKFEKFSVVVNNNYRREAVNYDNRTTIEFRMYRGTLKKETILATLELTDAICQFVKCHNSAECSSASSWSLFSSFLKTRNYRFLPQYLQSRGVK